MGLSSFGRPKYNKELSKLLFNTRKGFELNLDYFIHQNENIIKNIVNGQIHYKDLYSQKSDARNCAGNPGSSNTPKNFQE